MNNYSLQVPKETKAILKLLAEKAGKTLESYVENIIREAIKKNPPAVPARKKFVNDPEKLEGKTILKCEQSFDRLTIVFNDCYINFEVYAGEWEDSSPSLVPQEFDCENRYEEALELGIISKEERDKIKAAREEEYKKRDERNKEYRRQQYEKLKEEFLASE